jgi:hypothetical protein
LAYFPHHLEFINGCVDTCLGGLQGKSMLELGNQIIMNGFWGKTFSPRIEAKTGKEYYSRLGAAHTSFDMNGRDGAERVDLSQPIESPERLSTFDFVTNLGTTEHVEPYEAQYTCFHTIHQFTRTGGLMFHIVPAIEELTATGMWTYHCNNYYSRPFFDTLCKENGYRLIRQQVMDELLCVCLQKTTDQPFMADREAFLRGIVRREGGVAYTAINDRTSTPFRRVKFSLLRLAHRFKMTVRNLRSR